MLTSETTVKGGTGDTCAVSGTYKCQTHASFTIDIARDKTFPPCNGNGGHDTTWILVKRS